MSDSGGKGWSSFSVRGIRGWRGIRPGVEVVKTGDVVYLVLKVLNDNSAVNAPYVVYNSFAFLLPRKVKNLRPQTSEIFVEEDGWM